MSCRLCQKKYTSVLDAYFHKCAMNNEPEVIENNIIDRTVDTCKKKINRNLCLDCGMKLDNNVMCRVEHKCPKPEPIEVSEPIDIPNEKKSMCKYCKKNFVNLQKHLINCKKKF